MMKIGKASFNYDEPLYVNKDTLLVKNLIKAYQEVTQDYETRL